MKILVLSFIIGLFTALALAASPNKAVIVSYPSDTPDSVLEDAKKAVIDAGGMITHEYHLIKAFAAKASEQALKTVQTYGQPYNALIEDDSEVHANGNTS